MREVWVARRPAHKALLGTGAPALEPTVAAPALLMDEGTGLPVVAVIRYPGDWTQLRNALRSFPMDSTIRSAGIRNVSSVFGHVTRSVVMYRNGARAASAARRAPAAHQIVCGAAAELAEGMYRAVPQRAAQDEARARRMIAPEWFVDAAAWWTSGVINSLSPMPYHYDRNNIDAWSVMPVARRAVDGGHLHIPEYDVVLDCADGDTVYFAGYNLMHGVTPLRRRDAEGYRISAVYYALKGFVRAGDPGQELQRGREDRTRREDKLLERQRERGLLR